MWKVFSLVLLLAFLLVPLSLSGLTPEEKAELPNLSKESLIKIILLYEENSKEIERIRIERENALSLKEDSLNEREADLNQTETLLMERETDLIEKEGHLNLRESLLAESFGMVSKGYSQQFWTGFTYGTAFGGLAGGIGGYYLPH